MEDALNALERNKGDPTETFRQILHEPNARYDSVRQTITPIAMATHKKAVLAKPAHTSKYVRLIAIISEQKAHLEHMSCQEWSVFVQFLVTAYDHLREGLRGFDFIKATNDLFRALSSLLGSATASCTAEDLPGILLICETFHEASSRKETSCHPYVLKCVRVLTQLDVEGASSIGSMILEMGRVRNPMLIYEMYLFACLVPQQLDTLLSISPRVIESHEIEFHPAPEYGLTWFRPSSEADISKFIVARALSLATQTNVSEDGDEANDSPRLAFPPAKRFKMNDSEMYDNGAKLMAAAFKGGLKDEYAYLLTWLSSKIGPSRQCSDIDSKSVSGGSSSSYRNSPWNNSISESSSGNNRASSSSTEEDSAVFWTFILLAQSVSHMDKEDQLRTWNHCAGYIPHLRVSSAACFCLSQLVACLTLPHEIDGNILGKVKSLITTMGTSSYPALSSGSLALYYSLLNIKILDDKLQQFKAELLGQWFRTKITDGYPRFLTQLFASDCPPVYLQCEEVEDLLTATSFSKINDTRATILDKTANTSISSDDMKGLKVDIHLSIPSVPLIPQIQCKTVKDSIWILAFLAQSHGTIPQLANEETDAFTEEDMRALIWFANLANYLQWENNYCTKALSLARWDLPAKSSRSLSVALSVLQRPSPVVCTALLGYTSPVLLAENGTGLTLRLIEPFLQSYYYQRSSWFLGNLIALVNLECFKSSNEAQQLEGFIFKVVKGQSKYASLRKKLIYYSNNEETWDLMKHTSERAILEILYLRSITPRHAFSDRELTITDDLSSKDRVVAAVLMKISDDLSLAQFLSILAENDVANIVDLCHLSDILGYGDHGNGKQRMLSLGAMPLHFSGISSNWKEVLYKLSADRGLIQRNSHIIANTMEIKPDRTDQWLLGVIEEVMKGCMCSASDRERATCIKSMFIFLQAHRSHIPDNLLVSFFETASALMSTLPNLRDIQHQKQGYNATASCITNLVHKALEERENSDSKLICSTAACLNKAQLRELAFELLSWLPKTSVKFVHTVRTLKNLTIQEFPEVLQNFIETSEEPLYEYSLMLVEAAIDATEKSGVSTSFNVCKELPLRSIKYLVFWTNYLPLRHSNNWLALLGRLVSTRGLLSISEINMKDVRFSDTFLQMGSKKTGNTAFFDAVLHTYKLLPYDKKLKLHPFLQRIGELPEAVYAEDTVGEENWENEVEYRPSFLSSKSSSLSGMLLLAKRIAEPALKLLKLPSMGDMIFAEVPELLEAALPYLVATCYSSISPVQMRVRSSSGTKDSSTDLKFKADLEAALLEDLMSEKAHDITLRIVKRCYKESQKFPINPRDVALACMSFKNNSKSFPTAVELGILAIELIWNEDPGKPLLEDLIDCLRYFYDHTTEEAFKCALLPKQSEQGLLQTIKGTQTQNSWQQLDFDMINNEVKLSSDSIDCTSLDSSFQNVGLWHLANRIASDNTYYDFEKVWWLQEWDVAQNVDTGTMYIDGGRSYPLFKHLEYGILIKFFTGHFSEDEAFAELVQQDVKMSAILEDIVRVDRSTTLNRFELDDRDYEVARRGRETLLSQDADPMGLAKELKQSCEYYRAAGNINRSLSVALKLEQLANSFLSSNFSKIDNTVDTIRSYSDIESAKIEWDTGRHSAAILALRRIIAPFPDDSGNSDLADVYALLGTWSRAARDESDDAILNKYFLKASELASEQNMENVHHLFARFCDAACHDEALSTAIKDSERVRENERRQLDYLTKAIKDGNTDKVFQSKYRMSLRILKAETEDCEQLKNRRIDLTIRCIHSYLLSLAYGDNFEEDMGRFIALWLDLSHNRRVNGLVLGHTTSPKDETITGDVRTVPLRKFIPWMNQLTSRIGKNDDHKFQQALQGLVLNASVEHPHQTLWFLMNITRTRGSENDQASRERKEAAKNIIKHAHGARSALILHMGELADRIVQLGSEAPPSDAKKILLRSFGSTISHWWCNKLVKFKLPVPTATIPLQDNGDYSQVPFITYVNPEVDIAGGISAPKIISFIDSDGFSHKMILKGSEKDDLRQDAIMQQVFGIANQLLDRAPQQRHKTTKGKGELKKSTRRYRVRTYNVIPVGGVSGVIEFVKNTKSLQEILEPLHTVYGGKQEYSLRKARHVMHAKRDSNRTARISAFEDVMAHTPPQMRHFWTKRFRDPHEWFEAKTRWSGSTAVTSILGYVVGLGDRHCSNLLVDTTTGEVVHIDLGIAFDQGKLLYIPETVPFRLTRDMVDGMGIPGTAGVFTAVAETTLQLMRDQREQIMTVLEVLKHDALYTWRLPPVQLNRIQFGSENKHDGAALESHSTETGQADHALRGVRRKLANNLNCEAMVRDLIAQARDTNNLALIFSGWSPFY